MNFVDFVNDKAQELCGNWKKFNSFGWNYDEEIPDLENWCIVYTVNRDSDLLTQSNAEEIYKRLLPYLETEDIIEEHHGHWACGWVDGYSIRVIRLDWDKNSNDVEKKYTLAFLEWCEIQLQLENYPVLNEENFFEKEFEDTLENIKIEGRSMIKNTNDSWIYDVYKWLEENNPSAVEPRDGFGGYPSDYQIAEALFDLDNLDEDFFSLVEG